MKRPIKYTEAYTGLTNAGCGKLTAAILSTIWVVVGVECTVE